MSESQRYRLVTRSDFDGLVCAVLLKQRGIIDEISFVHPKDMQDGKVAIGPRDITTNLPYVAGCHMAFDHHASEIIRLGAERPSNLIIDAGAASAAGVVYRHFGGEEAFPGIAPAMMTAVDKADSAQFSRDEILNPEGWVLLNYLMDARTGLGRFRDFRVSNYQLMMELIDYCGTHTIDEILALPDVKERADLYFALGTGRRPDSRMCNRARQSGRTRPARRRSDLRHQPVHGLCDVSADQHFDSRPLGPEAPEHRIRDRQIDH